MRKIIIDFGELPETDGQITLEDISVRDLSRAITMLLGLTLANDKTFLEAFYNSLSDTVQKDNPSPLDKYASGVQLLGKTPNTVKKEEK